MGIQIFLRNVLIFCVCQCTCSNYEIVKLIEQCYMKFSRTGFRIVTLLMVQGKCSPFFQAELLLTHQHKCQSVAVTPSDLWLSRDLTESPRCGAASLLE